MADDDLNDGYLQGMSWVDTVSEVQITADEDFKLAIQVPVTLSIPPTLQSHVICFTTQSPDMSKQASRFASLYVKGDRP